ncbi:MAG: type II secretion system F family protein [Streptosporangiaceae bacterium]
MSGSGLLVGGLIAVGLGIAVLAFALLPGSPRPRGVTGALASIDRHYRQQDSVIVRSQDSEHETQLPGWARGLALRLSPKGFGVTLQRRLDLAGNSRRWTADKILAVKGVALIAGGMLGVLFGVHNLGLAVIYAAVGAMVGFFLPDVLLYNAGIKRQALILSALPDALDMLTVCVEAGLGFDGAVSQVAVNMRGPLAEEFARALQEMQIGLSRSEALRAMVARTTVAELQAFVSALVQASELGIPVARVLREQAGEMRIRRRQRAEEKAQKVPVKIMFPLVTCLFPALLVVIIGPGVIQIAHTLLHV